MSAIALFKKTVRNLYQLAMANWTALTTESHREKKVPRSTTNQIVREGDVTVIGIDRPVTIVIGAVMKSAQGKSVSSVIRAPLSICINVCCINELWKVDSTGRTRPAVTSHDLEFELLQTHTNFTKRSELLPRGSEKKRCLYGWLNFDACRFSSLLTARGLSDRRDLQPNSDVRRAMNLMWDLR